MLARFRLGGSRQEVDEVYSFLGLRLFISRSFSQMSPVLPNIHFAVPMRKIMLCRFEAKLR